MPSTHPPLRVLIANAVRLWAGAERFTLEAALGLRTRGHAVTVQAYPGKPLAVRTRAAGLTVDEVMTRGDSAPWTVLPLAARLRRRPVDVVVTCYDKDLRTVGLAAKLAGRGIAVVHTRECDVPLKDKLSYRLYYTRVADRVLANSQSTRRTTLASAPWLDQRRVGVLYKGIDPSPYLQADGTGWRSRLDPTGSARVIGFAGQLVPRKRCDVLLQLLAQPPLREKPWVLAIAGHGPQEQSLRRLAQEAGVAERVRFCGFVEPLAPWLAALDLFVLPSFVEGFGYVLAEAMAAGKPCVAYAASSTPEVVLDGTTGLLAPQGDDPRLAACLERLVDDPGLCARLGAAGRVHVQTNLTLARMIDGLEQELVQLAERGRRA